MAPLPLSALGETYSEDAATPAPLEQAVVAGKEQRGCGGSLVTEGLGGGRGSCETIRIWDGAHMAEPRTRRGALTAALTPLGET